MTSIKEFRVPTEATRRQQVAAEAEAVIRAARHSVYQHDTFVDVATRTYDMDCSGYVGYVLEQIAPRHYHTIPAAGIRPLAFEFYERFSSLPVHGADGWGWRRVASLMDARRGDIVAWRSERLEPGFNTGHVFVVVYDPETLADGVVAVRAYDSSNILHHNDTRARAGAPPATGLGVGTIRFRYTGDGPEFQFGRRDAFHECALAIARLEPIDD
jgi:hypothetical protein